jgi:hypothetical protein
VYPRRVAFESGGRAKPCSLRSKACCIDYSRLPPISEAGKLANA